MFHVVDLRCEYLRNPVGIGVTRPRISWRLQTEEKGILQSAYRIQVAEDPQFAKLVWDSGKVISDRSVHVELGELPAVSRTRRYYRVQAWNQRGTSSPWSESAYWETGLLSASEWKADWIAAPRGAGEEESEISPMLRGTFALSGSVREARLYATSLGLYELYLNGERVGDRYFTPGWTSYHKRLQYQTYDITALLKEGGNAIGAQLGHGWYSGNLVWKDKRHHYGDRRALLVQMHIVLEDGTEMIVASDGTWKVSDGPILMSELYHGETYDARLEQPGWTVAEFDDAGWAQAEILDHSKDILVAQENEPVRRIQSIEPMAVLTTPNGETVLDFGQNMVGWVRCTVNGQAGDEVVLHHAEVLDRDGNFYTDNLRSAQQTVRYLLKGGERETFEPHFTFQGFRYVRVAGVRGPVEPSSFEGVVLHSHMEPTGSFRCSDPLINQLQHNIEWGLKGNFLDLPTDCPQRDERLGWTGDAQMFIRTAAYLMNVDPFFTKWLRDVKADQLENGAVPHIVPNVLGREHVSSAAWGDAAVIIPWTLYLAYGDTRILEEQYDSMKAWVEHIRSTGDQEFLWNTGFHFGDWLGLDAKPNSYVGATDKDYIATAFFAYSTSLLRKAAAVLGKREDEEAYAVLYENILAAFENEFITPSGRLSVPTQTAQVLGLMFGLLRGEAKERAIRKLVELLEESKYHLTTGFVGTPYLNHVLSGNGQTEAAYKLLFQQSFPSWLYQVTKGATTVWEHWDGIREDGSFWSPDMNSFNHYAYGAIGDWLYRCVAGIDAEESEPGYKRISIRPQPPQDGLDWAEGKLQTMYGLVLSAWRKLEGGRMELRVNIPPNTQAGIVLPRADRSSAFESGLPLSDAEGIIAVAESEAGLAVSVGSGNYRFEWRTSLKDEPSDGRN